MEEAETKLVALTSWTIISTANSNLNGTTGSYGVVVTAASNGTLVKTILIKSQVTTSADGMIRLFVQNDGSPDSNVNLLMEIPIPIVKKTARDCSYYNVIPFNYTLNNGDVLLASTQNADTFNVIAECLVWKYQSPAPTVDTVQYTANTQGEMISTANSNLDGTGTLVNVFTADTAANGFSGCEIYSITIKAQQSVTPGMVRLYFQNTGHGNPILFCEVIIPAITQSATNPTFTHEVIVQGSITLQCSYSIWASTEKAEKFSVIVEAADWLYP